MSVVNPPLVPIGLRDLVKAFTKDLLHKQPQNIPEYAVEYFEKMLPDKQYNVQDYELHGYGETLVKVRKINQYPLSAVFAIFPKPLTQIIKEFIKAVLRENPKNLVEFAIQYFQRLREKNETFTVNYSTYINYINNKKSLTINPAITCPCGRTLTSFNGHTNFEEKKSHDEKSNVDILKIDTSDTSEKSIVLDRIKAVLILQRFFRKHLKNKREINAKISLEKDGKQELKDVIQDRVKAVLILQRFFKRSLKMKKEKLQTVEIENKSSKDDTVLKDPVKAVLVLQRFFRSNLKIKRERLNKVEEGKEEGKVVDKTAILDQVKAVLILQRFFRRILKDKKDSYSNVSTTNIEELQETTHELKPLMAQKTESTEELKKPIPEKTTSSSIEKESVSKNENKSTEQEEQTDILHVDEQGEVENNAVPIVQNKYDSFDDKKDLKTVTKDLTNETKSEKNIILSDDKINDKTENVPEVKNSINPAGVLKSDETINDESNKSPTDSITIEDTEVENKQTENVPVKNNISESNDQIESKGEKRLTDRKLSSKEEQKDTLSETSGSIDPNRTMKIEIMNKKSSSSTEMSSEKKETESSDQKESIDGKNIQEIKGDQNSKEKNNEIMKETNVINKFSTEPGTIMSSSTEITKEKEEKEPSDQLQNIDQKNIQCVEGDQNSKEKDKENLKEKNVQNESSTEPSGIMKTEMDTKKTVMSSSSEISKEKKEQETSDQLDKIDQKNIQHIEGDQNLKDNDKDNLKEINIQNDSSTDPTTIMKTEMENKNSSPSTEMSSEKKKTESSDQKDRIDQKNIQDIEGDENSKEKDNETLKETNVINKSSSEPSTPTEMENKKTVMSSSTEISKEKKKEEPSDHVDHIDQKNSEHIEDDKKSNELDKESLNGTNVQNDSSTDPNTIMKTEMENKKSSSSTEMSTEKDETESSDQKNRTDQDKETSKETNIQHESSSSTTMKNEREKKNNSTSSSPATSIEKKKNESSDQIKSIHEKNDQDLEGDQFSNEVNKETLKGTNVLGESSTGPSAIMETEKETKKILVSNSTATFKEKTENEPGTEKENIYKKHEETSIRDIEGEKSSKEKNSKDINETFNPSCNPDLPTNDAVRTPLTQLPQEKKDNRHADHMEKINDKNDKITEENANKSDTTFEKTSKTKESIVSELVKSICDEYTRSESAKTKSFENDGKLEKKKASESLEFDVGETVAKILNEATNFLGPLKLDDDSSNNKNHKSKDVKKLPDHNQNKPIPDETTSMVHSQSEPEKTEIMENFHEMKVQCKNNENRDLVVNQDDTKPSDEKEPQQVVVSENKKENDPQNVLVVNKSKMDDQASQQDTINSDVEFINEIKESTGILTNPSEENMSNTDVRTKSHDISANLSSTICDKTSTSTANEPNTETSIEKRINKDHFYTVRDFQLAEKREFTLDDIPESPPTNDHELKNDVIHSNDISNTKHFSTTPQLYDIIEENSASFEISKESMTDLSLNSNDSNSSELQPNIEHTEEKKDFEENKPSVETQNSTEVNEIVETTISKIIDDKENSPVDCIKQTEDHEISKISEKKVFELANTDKNKQNSTENNDVKKVSGDLSSIQTNDTDKEVNQELKLEQRELLKDNTHEENKDLGKVDKTNSEQEIEKKILETKDKSRETTSTGTETSSEKICNEMNNTKENQNKHENPILEENENTSQLSSKLFDEELVDSNVNSQIEYKHLSESTTTDSSTNNSENDLQIGRLDSSDEKLKNIETNLCDPDPEKVKASNVDKSVIKIDAAINENMDEQGSSTNIGNNNDEEQSDRQILQKSAEENNNSKRDEHEVDEKDEDDILTELQNLKPKQSRVFIRSNTDSVVVQPPDPAAFMDALANDSIDINDNDEKVLDKSFSLEGDIHDQIRQKIFACSLSESNSDSFDVILEHINESAAISANDDRNIKTALIEATGTSTDTESTIVSAVTKIQANTRGFLTRKRLRRESLSTKSSAPDEQKCSFGNAAINESLEYLVREAAAKKIQRFFRVMRQMKFKSNKQHATSGRSTTSSSEHSLAARRMTLQRGDALRNDSLPDEDSSTTTSTSTKQFPEEKTKKLSVSAKSYVNTSADRRLIWQLIRRNSMPVQIDSEVFRVLPKHMKKRISSAESRNKNTQPSKLFQKK